MVTRAGVSERAFYEVFDSVEDCYWAAFQEGLERLSRTVVGAAGGKGSWLDRLRAGLVAFLGFLDDDLGWARLLILETPVHDGAVALGCHQRVLGVLTGLMDDGAPHAIGEFLPDPMLTSEFAIGGVVSVIRQHMLSGNGGPLVELAPHLMSFVVRPYFGQAAAMAELAGKPSPHDQASSRPSELSQAAALPIRVTHRTTLVLRAIAQTPYSSNRGIADAAGLNDEGQASKLLARLERQGVIENVGIGAARGEPNAWLLTSSGRHTVELLGDGLAPGTPRSSSARARGMA